MTILQSIILGVIQGLTEFLPISSSGHLVIIPYLLGWKIPPREAFIFDVLVQVSTLIAVIVYFWNDLTKIAQSMTIDIIQRKPFRSKLSRLGWLIILATIPAGIIGFLFKDSIETTFNNPILVAFFLYITASLLLVSEWVGNRNRSLRGLNWKDAVWIGLFQVLAVFPGTSRSGSTIAGGMTRNFERTDAAKFSFLMSIPIMLAAGVLAFIDLAAAPNLEELLLPFLPGFVTAAIVGYLTIRWLLRYLTRHPLFIFALYCFIIGTLVLVNSFI